jgi:hypothetical protein
MIEGVLLLFSYHTWLMDLALLGCNTVIAGMEMDG